MFIGYLGNSLLARQENEVNLKIGAADGQSKYRQCLFNLVVRSFQDLGATQVIDHRA